MSGQRRVLPTLTEVIAIDPDPPEALPGPVALLTEALPMEPPPPLAGLNADDLAAQVMQALWPRIDALVKERLREVLAPQLAQLAEDTALRVRGEVFEALPRLAAQAVKDVLARPRS